MNPVEVLAAVGAVVLAGLGLVGWVIRGKERREAKRRRRQGERNAERAGFRAEEVCVSCSHRVDPEIDIYDRQHQCWWHLACWRELNGQEGEER